MDPAYARILVRLLASPDGDPSSPHGQNTADNATSNYVFPLPRLSFYPVGEIVLLGDARNNEDSGLDLRANVLTHHDLTSCLFSNLFAHPMRVYRRLAIEFASAAAVGIPAPPRLEGVVSHS